MARLINEAYAAIAHAPLRYHVAMDTVPQRESPPENLYEDEWKRYATWRTKLGVLILIELLSFFLLVPSVAFIGIFVLPAGIAYTLLFLSTINQLYRFFLSKMSQEFLRGTNVQS